MFEQSKPLSPRSLIRFLFRAFSTISIALVIIVCTHPALACLTPGSLIGGFDRDSYVFLGKVKGYTAPATIQGSPSKFFGLKVKATDLVFPTGGPDEYIVFPMRMMADCTRGGFGIDELKATYPIGSEIRVIGRTAKKIEVSSTEQVVLEAGFQNHTSVSLNPLDESKGRSSISTEFDYSLATDKFLDSRAERFHYVAFEVQKDLVRLERAKSDAERQSVLNRLKKAPDYAQLSFDLIEATSSMSRPGKSPE